MLLKGCETKGYVIISAAQARILQHLHPPVWRERSLVSKTSWHCSLDGMQYFATISAGEQDAMDENILWLNTDLIGARDVRGVVNLPGKEAGSRCQLGSSGAYPIKCFSFKCRTINKYLT